MYIIIYGLIIKIYNVQVLCHICMFQSQTSLILLFFFFFIKKKILYLYLNILDYNQIKLYIFAMACDIQVLTAEFSGRIR